MTTPVDPSAMAALTDARVALGRTGSSQPTQAALAFALDHARARDAVHRPADFDGLEAALQQRGLASLRVDSAAQDRLTYLARPDLGRRLSDESRKRLAGLRAKPVVDLAIVVADGLSSRALDHVPALLDALLAEISPEGWTLAPVILAAQSRVALGDEVGALLKARMVLLLVGERPGLSSPDSLGAYLTYAPRVGLSDAARNCVSNIRPAGLIPAQGAFKIAWLMRQARRLQLTGVALKDESSTDHLVSVTPEAARLPADTPLKKNKSGK
ncbi:ethanolamine ammonia-lyase subunit EutC [Phenylobacterium sp.]|uniref:ethanolamine ammonia-lyase subunit EutC n=1 Tax=Phenylobacterium sp. TaxID=1871053 RepID=UPI002602B4AE|nr:ethanolamine ammonia-lyase subunit EutC [Phenylobacterium sp.]